MNGIERGRKTMSEAGEATDMSNHIERTSAATLTMSSREISELMGKQHRHVMRDIRQMLEQLNGSKIGPVKYSDAKGELRDEYHLPKRETLILVSGYSVELRARIIDRWQELERQINTSPSFTIPQTMGEALRLAADLAEQKAEAEVALAIAAPKAEALDRLATADGSLCVTDAAKALQMRSKDLFDWLRSNRWIYRRAGTSHDIGYQSHTTSGLLEHKVTTVLRSDGSEKITEQVRITPKGMARLSVLIKPAVRLVVDHNKEIAA